MTVGYLGISGQSHNNPPQDFEGLRAVAMSARSPVVSRMLGLMEPVSPVRGYRPAGNRWRHYERWRIPLANFYRGRRCILLVQSHQWPWPERRCRNRAGFERPASSFRPSRSVTSRRLSSGTSSYTARPLANRVGNHFRFPATHGRRTLRISLITLYRDLTLRSRDPVVQKHVQSVLDMTMPLSALWRPSFLWRILRSESNLLLRRRSIRPNDSSEMPPPMPPMSS
jgi:hypothetical protein